MNYGIAVLYFLLPYYIGDSMAAYIAYLLAGRRMPYRKVFTLQIFAALIQSMTYSAFILLDEEAPNLLSYYFWSTIDSITAILMAVFWIYFLFWDTEKKKRFFYVSTVFPFTVLASYGTNALVAVMSPEFLGMGPHDLATPSRDAFLFIPSYLIVHGSIAAIIRLASKTSFWNKLQAFGNHPKFYIPMGRVYFLFFAVFGSFISGSIPGQWYIPAITLPYIVLLGLAVFLASYSKKTENLNAARNLLLQQQNYINKLEAIQKAIRAIQHDYKNMLAGLYVQASEGNVNAIKEYIDAKLLRVDETVREDLHQTNQLIMIELPELKGLIMSKILEAERNEVSFCLEVMFPVKKTSMAAEDLLCCVGILLDNAIEEARTQKDAVVTLLLFQQDRVLTIVVKNPVRVKPDLSQIRNTGYTTKGPGRGVGLSEYQNIIRKYPNTSQETKIEGEYFIQVLVLAEKP